MRVTGHRVQGRRAARVLPAGQVGRNNYTLIVIVLILLAIMTWSFWPVGEDLLDAWQGNDDYSAGQLVPFIALFLLWRQRKAIVRCSLVPCWWAGIAILLLAQACRTFGLLTFRPSPERYALILTAAGAVLIVAGWQVFRRVVWILLFLFLMFPLPWPVHKIISGPLQNIATTGSVFVLEAFGATVSQRGNIVVLNETTLMAIAEACSGLRMLTAFVIVAAFVAYMVKRPRWQKAVLLLSSVPVAVMCNILRLCVTAVLFMLVSAEVGQKFFHDFAGMVMMPAAALLLFAELRLMDKLIVPDSTG